MATRPSTWGPPPPGGWSPGLEVRLQQVTFAVSLFKLVAPNGDIERVVPIILHLRSLSGGSRHAYALAGRRVSPQIQAAHRLGEIPVSAHPSLAQSLSLLLSGLGVTASVCSANGSDYLPGPSVITGPILVPTPAKARYSRPLAGECASFTRDKPGSKQESSQNLSLV